MILNRQKSLIVFLVMMVLCLGIMCAPAVECANDTVTLQVIGDDDRGIMLQETKIPFEKGSTALSVLVKHYEKGKVVVRGGLAHGYVEEIDGLSEGKLGPLSGWMYEVNRTKPEVDAGSTKLKPGDKVIWEYSNGYY